MTREEFLSYSFSYNTYVEIGTKKRRVQEVDFIECEVTILENGCPVCIKAENIKGFVTNTPQEEGEEEGIDLYLSAVVFELENTRLKLETGVVKARSSEEAFGLFVYKFCKENKGCKAAMWRVSELDL